MANTKSAIKRIRTSEKRRQRNQAVKSSTRTFVKKARLAIGRDAEAASESLTAAISALDRAATKGVIHPNNAARRKSRLMKAYNASRTPPVVEEAPAEVTPAKKTRSRAAKGTGTTRATTRAKKTSGDAG